MFQTLYLDRQTALHRLDPRTKILGLLLTSACLFTFNHPLYIGMVGLGVIAAALAARATPNYIHARYLLLICLVMPMVVWSFYLRPSGSGFFQSLASRDSISFGIAAGIRLCSIFILGILFASVTSVEELMHGLVGLKVPFAIAFITSLAMRLVPGFAGVLSSIVEAQVSRGLDLETRNPVKRIIALAPVVLPFLVYAFRYSLLLSVALETRGFSLDASRTYLTAMKMTRVDYLVLIGLLVTEAAFLVLGTKGFGAVVSG